jgi:membrane protease YdiL (CAAX protease family)
VAEAVAGRAAAAVVADVDPQLVRRVVEDDVGVARVRVLERADHFFSGNWGWFAMLVAVALLAPVVEELLFPGLLLPRM